MREPTNPFHFRSSENIDSHIIFLKLFGLGILDALPDDCFSNKVTVFQSGPGGGKTSLFRIFRPDSLREISRDRSSYDELSQWLLESDVIGKADPNLLGVYLRLYHYATLQNSESGQRDGYRYLFTLMGIRLIMKTLTGILDLKGLDMDQLYRITVQKPQDHCIAELSLPCSGKELYDWAAGMERSICGTINRFDEPDNLQNIPCQGIEYMHILHHKNFFLDGRQAAPKMLIMLDDLHELTKPQRRVFLERIASARLPSPIWISERLGALELKDLVLDDGRESNTVRLEDYWANRSRSFENFVRSISIKRAVLARTDFDIYLDERLENSIDTKDRNDDFIRAAKKIEEDVRHTARDTRAYEKWIEEQNLMGGSNYTKAVRWRMLQIQIARDMQSTQRKILDVPLDPKPTDRRPDLEAAAVFFLHDEFKIPYFFGFSNMAKMATFNVEVFLKIAAKLFDEIVSQQIKNKKHEMLSAERQEEIVEAVAKNHFEQILKTNTNGSDMLKFLSELKKFAREQTNRENAPYIPGVTGIGIRKKLYEQLLSDNEQKPEYVRLIGVLRSCISNNYLKAKYDAQQGKPGNPVVTLYLNRLLCAAFDLPLGKGGWRYKTPDELCGWLEAQTTKRGRLQI